MTDPYIDKSRFTLDRELPVFEIYQDCSVCGERLPVDDLEEGMCVNCHLKYEELDEPRTDGTVHSD